MNLGASFWFFLRPRPGELCTIAQRAVEDFISGDGQLPVDEEASRYAQGYRETSTMSQAPASARVSVAGVASMVPTRERGSPTT